jgi:hypothetical protein
MKRLRIESSIDAGNDKEIQDTFCRRGRDPVEIPSIIFESEIWLAVHVSSKQLIKANSNRSFTHT